MNRNISFVLWQYAKFIKMNNFNIQEKYVRNSTVHTYYEIIINKIIIIINNRNYNNYHYYYYYCNASKNL